MSKPEMKAPAPKDAKLKLWKPSIRFVDFKGRSIVIKLHDPENGFERGETMMTVNGPMATSHAESVKIDKHGYMAKSEGEEKALLKLATLPTHGSKGGSYLVTWENREMPAAQRQAELTAHQYKKQIDELQEKVASASELEQENAKQAELIETLKRQLGNIKGG